AEFFSQGIVLDAVLDETVRQRAYRACGDAKGRLLCKAAPAAPRRGVLPGEEGEDGAGLADLIAVVQVIGARIVEVHRSLDEAQPGDERVEVQIARGLAGNR